MRSRLSAPRLAAVAAGEVMSATLEHVLVVGLGLDVALFVIAAVRGFLATIAFQAEGARCQGLADMLKTLVADLTNLGDR